MRLILDSIADTSTEVITEAASSGEKKYYIEGVFAQAELKNRNGRVYPRAVLESAVSKFQPMIAARRALGELNHPATPQVNPERASHLIEKLHWQGNNVMGRAKILTTLPMGKIAKGLIDEGVRFGVSTRGMGSVTESTGGKIVGSDFVMSTIDLVSDPSGIDCFVDGLMENQQWVFDATSGMWAIAEAAQAAVRKAPARQMQEEKLNIFAAFLSQIR